MFRLKATDRKILCELDRDSRQTYTEIGELLGLAGESVRQRVEKLTRDGVIQWFFTVIDAARLGFAYHKVFLRLHNASESDAQRITDYLCSRPDVVWVVSFDGKFDLGFSMRVRTMQQLSEIVEEVLVRFNKFISQHVFCANIRGEYLGREYLVGKGRKRAHRGHYSSDAAILELDQRDQLIISSLTNNSRLSLSSLARNLDLSVVAVMKRLRRLEAEQVITRYTIVLNHSAIGQTHYRVLFHLNACSKSDLDAFYASCHRLPHITYGIKTLGEWDYEVDIEVPGVEEFRSTVRSLTREHASIIREYHSLAISHIHKYNLFPV